MNFIREYNHVSQDLCDEIIDFFHQENVLKTPGAITRNGEKTLDPEFKNSTDFWIPAGTTPAPWLTEYVDQLTECTKEYVKEFPYSVEYGRWTICEGMRIQWYKPGESFCGWHTERIDASFPNATRHLVFMTYLNDVEDGGETEFFHQNLKTKAVKGKTVIWPADWTYTHRGVVSPTQHKYIITGWYNYQYQGN